MTSVKDVREWLDGKPDDETVLIFFVDRDDASAILDDIVVNVEGWAEIVKEWSEGIPETRHLMEWVIEAVLEHGTETPNSEQETA